VVEEKEDSQKAVGLNLAQKEWLLEEKRLEIVKARELLAKEQKLIEQ